MIAWDVWLNGRKVDTVFFTESCDAEYVRDSLVNHDGFNPSITVQKGNR